MISLEELQAAWEQRLLALRLERTREAYRTQQGRAQHLEHMKHWTRAVSALPGRSKLQWVQREGRPDHRSQDCIVMGVIYLEWHE